MSLAASGKRRSSALALADEHQQFDWAEFDIILNRATNGLMDLAADTRMRVGVFAGNSAETAIVHIAALASGVSSVPLNPQLTADELTHILKDADIGIVFVDRRTVAAAIAATHAMPGVRLIAWRCDVGTDSWEGFLGRSASSEPPTSMPPRPHLHYTSGTTGRPKGVETPPTMLPRTSTVAELFAQLRREANALPAGVGLAAGPLYHTGPLMLVRHLAGGQPLVTMERFEPELLLAAVERFGASRTVLVPTHFQRLLALPPATRARYDVSSLRMIAHTGAACPRDVKMRMIEWFGPILIEAYGATEAGSTNVITSEEWLARPGSVGRTQPPFELCVIGEDGGQLGSGEIGQLYFRDTTGRGILYHNDVEKTRAAHREPGVFTLGEVGYADADGYVFITDRISDMIVSGGVNIYPAEVEQALISHPDIHDVAVIGVPNGDMGEETKALVVPTDHANAPAPEMLDQFCRQQIAAYKCPRSYDIVQDIGRNAMGKIDKRALRRPFWPSDRTIGG